jgi:multidrug efflux system outer membrane protein
MKKYISIVFIAWLSSCKAPQITSNQKPFSLPEGYQSGVPTDSSSAKINWREYFADDHLVALIDSALQNNQDIKIAMQQIEMANSGALATSAALKPTVNFAPAASMRRFGLYTMDGAGNISTDIMQNKPVPIHLPDFLLGFQASWEIDLYKKLSNTNKAALTRVLASQEAKNYVVTAIVNEIASAYYELKALDTE